MLNEFKNAYKLRTIRFSESLSNKLQDVADQKGVSFNTVVLQAITYALENLPPCDKNELP